MAEKGAYSPEEVYDEETIDEVVRYAGEVNKVSSPPERTID